MGLDVNELIRDKQQSDQRVRGGGLEARTEGWNLAGREPCYFGNPISNSRFLHRLPLAAPKKWGIGRSCMSGDGDSHLFSLSREFG